jgi:hypothetical protein
LIDQGHEVTVFHRGNAKPALPYSVRGIAGDRNDLASQGAEFERFSPDVVLDFLLSIVRTIEWERNNPPACDPKLFDYAAEDDALRQFTG